MLEAPTAPGNAGSAGMVGDFLLRRRTTTVNKSAMRARRITTAPIVHTYASTGFCDDGLLVVGVGVFGIGSVFACCCVYVTYGCTALKSGYLVAMLANSWAALCQ